MPPLVTAVWQDVIVDATAEADHRFVSVSILVGAVLRLTVSELPLRMESAGLECLQVLEMIVH